MLANLENRSGHRTGKCQFSFQFPKRAMPKNVQTTIKFCSVHMLARLCSKSLKIGFSNIELKIEWIENFQMYKLDFEEAEEPEITLLTSVGSQRKQESSRKTSASLTTLKPFTMFSSVTQSCLTLCNLTDCSTSGFPVHHQLPELAQTQVHRFSNAIQPSHPLLTPSSAFNLAQHQGLFQWVSSSHQVAKILELQHQ